MCTYTILGKAWAPQTIVITLVLLRSSSPDSQNVSVELSVRLPIIACLLEALISTLDVRSFKASTQPLTCCETVDWWLSCILIVISSSSSDRDKILLMLLNTWLLCRNMWSAGVNRIPQHRIAACCSGDPRYANQRYLITFGKCLYSDLYRDQLTKWR